MRIGKRLILNTVVVLLFSVLSTSIILGWTMYRLMRSALENQIKNQLTAIRDIKKHEIESYFALLQDQAMRIAGDHTVVEGAGALKKAFVTHTAEASSVSDLGELFNKEKAIKIKDAYFIDPVSGTVFYATKKNIDAGLNIKEAEKMLPGLYKAFISANQQTGRTAAVADFHPDMPGMGDESAFIAAPIFDGDKKIAIMVLQWDTHHLSDIMTNNKHWQEEGMGDTGETYLVGEDFRLRSMSRFFYQDPDKYLEQMKSIHLAPTLIEEMKLKNSSVGRQPVLTEGSKAAHNGSTGFLSFKDYRNTPVLSAFAPLNIPNLDWVILSEMDVSEAFAPIHQLLHRLIVSTISIAAALSLLGLWCGARLSQRISRPIQRFAQLITTIAKDLDLTKRISVKTEDELSDMAQALNHLFDRFQATCVQTVKSTNKMHETAAMLKKMVESRAARGDARKGTDAEAKATVKADADTQEQITKASENLETLSKKLSKVSNQFKIIQKEARRTREW